MRGDTVVVRAFRGKALVRRVWDVAERAVFICSEENFRLLNAGRPGLWPVGFPKEDVFQYDAGLIQGRTGDSRPDPTFWQCLEHWREPQD